MTPALSAVLIAAGVFLLVTVLRPGWTAGAAAVCLILAGVPPVAAVSIAAGGWLLATGLRLIVRRRPA